MASHRCQCEVIPPRSLMLIQGIAIEGSFNLWGLLIECFHCVEAYDCFYIFFFCDRRIEVKCPINLHAFLETLLLTIIHEWRWETLFSLQGTYYPYQVQNTNMYSVFVGITFRVTTYDQSFLVFSRSIRCVLSCLNLTLTFLFFS